MRFWWCAFILAASLVTSKTARAQVDFVGARAEGGEQGDEQGDCRQGGDAAHRASRQGSFWISA